MREEKIARSRRQLAKHVWRMRVKSGCTFEEIARAVRCTVGEARELFKEAMRRGCTSSAPCRGMRGTTARRSRRRAAS